MKLTVNVSDLAHEKLVGMAEADDVSVDELIESLVKLGWSLRECTDNAPEAQVHLPRTCAMYPVAIRCVRR